MSFIKSKLILAVIALLWISMIVLMSPLQIPVTILAFKFPSLKPWRYGLWISQDQMINAILMGNPDVTVSSKVGYMAMAGSDTAKNMARVIDFLFYITIKQKNHCAVSIERDEKHNVFTASEIQQKIVSND